MVIILALLLCVTNLSMIHPIVHTPYMTLGRHTGTVRSWGSIVYARPVRVEPVEVCQSQ